MLSLSLLFGSSFFLWWAFLFLGRSSSSWPRPLSLFWCFILCVTVSFLPTSRRNCIIGSHWQTQNQYCIIKFLQKYYAFQNTVLFRVSVLNFINVKVSLLLVHKFTWIFFYIIRTHITVHNHLRDTYIFKNKIPKKNSALCIIMSNFLLNYWVTLGEVDMLIDPPIQFLDQPGVKKNSGSHGRHLQI